MIQIRNEKVEEHHLVENIVREAFWNVYRPGCNEHLILHNFRRHPNYVTELSNVMTVDDQPIGQIMFSKAKLLNQISGETVNIGIFGPVSILPEFQKQGYGEQLIRYTIEKAKSLGFTNIVIFGNPDYYHKFGFQTAAASGVFINGQEEEDVFDFVMILKLAELEAISKETAPWPYQDPEGYEIDEQELNQFEKNFPYKEKEINDHQL